MSQLDLFQATVSAYMRRGEAENAAVYADVARALGEDPLQHMGPVGKKGVKRNLLHRRIRWVQQTLKDGRMLERTEGRRGVWRLTGKGRRQLTQWADQSASLVAFSTSLGVAILGDCRSVFSDLDAPVTLCVTSPPYPLRNSRAYGNERGERYIDFICEALEPIVGSLKPGGSIVLNVSNDIFEAGSPARSLYRERMVLALNERLGLWKMDEIPWVNRSKPPGPTHWACKNRQQLAVAWEPVYWLTNDPAQCDADNRRVLQPHTRRQSDLIAVGGEQRTADYGDGAYRLRPGNFGRETEGSIPKNVIEAGHACAGTRSVHRYCDRHGLPRHGAMFPERLVDFFIQYLSRVGDLVVDPFAGGGTVPNVAERLGRRWVATDLTREYLQAAGGARFSRGGTWFNPELFSNEAGAQDVAPVLAA